MTLEQSLRSIVAEELEHKLKGRLIEDEPLITRKEIIARLEISDNTFRKMCVDYNLPYYPGGTKGVRYRYSEVLDKLRRHHKV